MSINVTMAALRSRIEHTPPGNFVFMGSDRGCGIGERQPDGKIKQLDWGNTPRAIWHWLDGYDHARNGTR